MQKVLGFLFRIFSRLALITRDVGLRVARKDVVTQLQTAAKRLLKGVESRGSFSNVGVEVREEGTRHSNYKHVLSQLERQTMQKLR